MISELKLEELSVKLNKYGALLAGVEEILDAEDLGGNARYVAAKVCGEINGKLCKMADSLGAFSKEIEVSA